MDVFAILKAEQVEALIGAAKPVSFKAGDAVSSRGSSGTSALWIIIDGFVTITRPDAKDASKAEVLGRLGCGEHFGAKNIVDEQAPREVDVVADTPLTCLTLERQAPFRVDVGFSDEEVIVSARFGLPF